MTPDAREAKLPQWTRDLLRDLRRQQVFQEKAIAQLDDENELLRALADGKFAEETNADTFLVSEDTGKEVPLGKGASIRFADFYSARYDDPQRWMRTGGARVLIIETDTPMQIRPTIDPCVIIIARAG
jgi:hypothetical protein